MAELIYQDEMSSDGHGLGHRVAFDLLTLEEVVKLAEFLTDAAEEMQRMKERASRLGFTGTPTLFSDPARSVVSIRAERSVARGDVTASFKAAFGYDPAAWVDREAEDPISSESDTEVAGWPV